MLTDEERAWLDEVSQEPLRYPRRHGRNTASDPLRDADLAYLRPHLWRRSVVGDVTAACGLHWARRGRPPDGPSMPTGTYS